ncbi:MAG TPA: DUF4397 domain-containing protein [Terriglobales bacterium]|nr:DUF4397 domain-containing protein [Terriglobales bacterium]
MKTGAAEALLGENKRKMLCRLKLLLLTLPLAAVCLVTTGCGSGSDQAQVRFVHAIQNVGPMDIDITTPPSIVPVQVFTNVSFLGVRPNQPGYTPVDSGTDTIAGFLTGTPKVAFNSTALDLNGSQQYTVIATGVVANGQNASILTIPDDIPNPVATNLAFRVINASPSGPDGTQGAVDVYIQLNPTNGPSGSPEFKGVAYQQSGGYITLPYNPNNDVTAPGYTVFVTKAGSTTPPYIIAQGLSPTNGGAVRTIVLTDVQNGNTMSSTFLELSDLD